jgi:hypothetical protein
VKIYTFLIGTHDDFETLDELLNWFENGTESKNGWGSGLTAGPNASSFEFDCPADCSEELVTMIGRGYAFSSDWCMDDTFSAVIEGTLTSEEPDQNGTRVNEALEMKMLR